MYAQQSYANQKRATDKQVAFISRLMKERNHAILGEPENMTTQQASRVISDLLAAPLVAVAVVATPAAPRAVTVTDVGMYCDSTSRIFKVQKSKETGNLYAMELVPIGGKRLTEIDEVVSFRFEYARGAIFTLTPSDRLSIDDAKAFGIRYGVCCVCGRTLVDAKSVANGIGPVCASRV